MSWIVKEFRSCRWSWKTQRWFRKWKKRGFLKEKCIGKNEIHFHIFKDSWKRKVFSFGDSDLRIILTFKFKYQFYCSLTCIHNNLTFLSFFFLFLVNTTGFMEKSSMYTTPAKLPTGDEILNVTFGDLCSVLKSQTGFLARTNKRIRVRFLLWFS